MAEKGGSAKAHLRIPERENKHPNALAAVKNVADGHRGTPTIHLRLRSHALNDQPARHSMTSLQTFSRALATRWLALPMHACGWPQCTRAIHGSDPATPPSAAAGRCSCARRAQQDSTQDCKAHHLHQIPEPPRSGS
jgi:hypothetical protein